MTEPTYPAQPDRALVVGDMHGNLRAWAYTVMPAYARTKADVIIQVGDMGYGWNPDYLPALDVILEAHGATVLWLDGNHENFDALEDANVFGVRGAKVQTSERTWYLPRGYTWEWHGVRCMALGGAYSVDKPYRTPHRSWWPQEEITDADTLHALEQLEDEPIDVLFAHDSFSGVRVPGVHAEWKQDEFAELCAPNRDKLLQVVERGRPKLFIHGHYHVGYMQQAETQPNLRIIGLNCEHETNSCMTLDFPNLKWEGAN